MNLIWIVSDTLRRDHLGCHGNQTVRTPSMDAFAAKSVRFDRHYAASFPTMPARADFFTGKFTASFMFWEPLPAGTVTLADILAGNKFNTAAVVDTPFYLRRGMNYDKGFQSIIEFPGQTGAVDKQSRDIRADWRHEADRFAPRTFTVAGEWLEKHYKENFFLYVDAWDPHEPWEAPDYYTEPYWPGYDGEQVRLANGRWQDVPGLTIEKINKAHAAYCGEITMVDTWLGYFLRKVENLGLADNTAIIFTSDHGFCFGEHGFFGKINYKTYRESQKTLESAGKSRADGDHTPEEIAWLNSRQTTQQDWMRTLYFEEVTACPLMIYVPGTKPGVYTDLTWAPDLMPTALDILGVKVPAGLDGHSLVPAIKNQKVKGRDAVFTTASFKNPGDKHKIIEGSSMELGAYVDVTITTREWTLLYNPAGTPMLYHMPADPKQENNVASQYPEKVKELHGHLIKIMNDTGLDASHREPRLKLPI